MISEFFANGKLLLSGEYVVLDGALAIGLPTKLGQSLKVHQLKSDESSVLWTAFLPNHQLWFEVSLDQDLNCIKSTDEALGENISGILKAVKSLNPNAFTHYNLKFETHLDFPKDWGLGSSSTLISLLSKFADINAFELLNLTFGGSGYDVSCALFPKTQSYQLKSKDRKVNFIHLDAAITKHCYFVYLNQKQNSREGIQEYNAIEKDKTLIKSISELSSQIISCKSLEEFEDILYVHEQLISEFLEIPTVQEDLFPDYKHGFVKSLGAWGGDFVLVTNQNNDLSYFTRKGFDKIFAYKDFIV